MKINNILKAGMFCGGIATLIVLAGEVIDSIIDSKLSKNDIDKGSDDRYRTVESVEETSSDESSADVEIDVTVNDPDTFMKKVVKVAATTVIVSVACIVANERGFNSGVIGGAYFFTRIGATNEQAGAMISDHDMFDKVLCVLRKAR